MFTSNCVSLGEADDEGGINSCSMLEQVDYPYMRHVPPGTYYVKVFPWTTAAVPFNYTMLATYTAFCGNGIIEGSETCDGTPGCAARTACRSRSAATASSGNSEECDDGNSGRRRRLLGDLHLRLPRGLDAVQGLVDGHAPAHPRRRHERRAQHDQRAQRPGRCRG